MFSNGSFCVEKIRRNFPFFKNNPSVIYLDSAATTHKPHVVIDTLVRFYSELNAPLHRGIYQLSENLTESFEKVRMQVAHFIKAKDCSEIIFTSGATAGINMVAQGWGDNCLQEGDEVVITQLEHHSNFVPWQMICLQKKALLKIIPVTREGELDLSNLENIITSKTKMVAIAHVSNALGTPVDVATIIARARAVGARVLVDGCQAAPYQPIDVQGLDCDFYVFSGHKMLAPTGVGIVYAHQRVHQDFPPSAFGGGSVFSVTPALTTFLKAPRCYEAGTPPVAQVIGLSAAVTYLDTIGMDRIHSHVARLTQLAIDELLKLPHIKILGPVDLLREQGHMVSFVVERMHAHDVAAYLDQHGICVRAGNHCAQPLANSLGYDASVRASFYLYTTEKEIEILVKQVANLR